MGTVELDAGVQAIGEAICTFIIAVVAVRSRRDKSLVLPIHEWILLAYFAVSLGHCIKLSYLGYDGRSTHCSAGQGWCAVSVALEGFFWGAAHVVLEGVACLLCQRGSGKRSLFLAVAVGSVWGSVTWVVTSSYASGWTDTRTQWTNAAMFTWEGLLVLLYLFLSAAPSEWLYRRPALATYALYTLVIRSMLSATVVMVVMDIDAGYCMRAGANTALFSLGLPCILLHTLHMDSLYWTGTLEGSQRHRLTPPLCSGSAGMDESPVSAPVSGDGVRESPLSALLSDNNVSIDVKAGSLETLAQGLDSSSKSGIQLIPHGQVILPDRLLLGAGGTAKVFNGRWSKRAVAIKAPAPRSLLAAYPTL